MKGIILAGGSGTRLHPITSAVSKQLVPVYDKPMIYYPLTTLMLAGINEILIITTPHDSENFKRLLGDGSQWGIALTYAIQDQPNGLAEAFIIGADFLAGGPSALVLGDNIFYGHGLPNLLRGAIGRKTGASVFAYHVTDPERYGVVEFDSQMQVIDIAANLKPSPRGELEITDVNRHYLEKGQLSVELMGRGYAWLDTGTPDSLLEAAQFVATLEKRQSFKIACPEEVAFHMGYIGGRQLEHLAESLKKSAYGRYLKSVLSKH
jgi:glucose-1-phosphate thymidylyltransferase